MNLYPPDLPFGGCLSTRPRNIIQGNSMKEDIREKIRGEQEQKKTDTGRYSWPWCKQCSMRRSGSDYVEKAKKSVAAKRCPLRGPLYRWERSWRRARFWHPSPTRRARGGGRTLLRRQPNGSPGVELVTGPSAVSLFVFVAPVAAF